MKNPEYELFSELFEAQLQAVIWLKPIKDEDGEVVDFEFAYCNEEGLKYLNMQREDFRELKLSNTTTVTEELRAVFFDEMLKVYQTGEKKETRIYNPALNKYARVLRARLRDGVLTIVQDRTEENRMIKILEKQKNLLDNILQYSPAGISVTEVIRDGQGNVVDGRTILANEKAVEYIEIPEEAYLNQTIKQIDPALFESPLFQMALDTLKHGIAFHTEYYFEPSKRWLELSVSKMDDDHLINVFMDITFRKEAQLNQEKLLKELQHSNTNLEDFAYAASHDLKEPIRKVLIFSDRLKNKLKDKLAEEDISLFNRLEGANRRMGSLVDDLLTYSQVGHPAETNTPVDLNALMNDILDDLELEIEEKDARISIEQLPVVKGHQRQLQQLFQNLLGNSLKYVEKGAQPEIFISCKRMKGERTSLNLSQEELNKNFYVIEVSDKGIGFNQEDADRIFNVFQRLHGRKEYSGSGVGLAIAQRVAHNHGGYINAESQPGKGASFKVYLPEVNR